MFGGVRLEPKDVTAVPPLASIPVCRWALDSTWRGPPRCALIFHSCEQLWGRDLGGGGGRKGEEKEMSKTNKNTHNAPLWTLLWLRIITLRSALPAHLLLPVNTAYRRALTHNHRRHEARTHTLTHAHTLTHTNKQTSGSARSIAAAWATAASTGRNLPTRFWPGLPRC